MMQEFDLLSGRYQEYGTRVFAVQNLPGSLLVCLHLGSNILLECELTL